MFLLFAQRCYSPGGQSDVRLEVRERLSSSHRPVHRKRKQREAIETWLMARQVDTSLDGC